MYKRKVKSHYQTDQFTEPEDVNKIHKRLN